MIPPTHKGFPMKKMALISGLSMLAILSLNLIWLVRSTARITNAGEDRLDAVVVHVREKAIALGPLFPGEHRFILLPLSGESPYEVSVVQAGQQKTVCQAYIEGSLYHVETVLQDDRGSKCTISFPLTSALLVWKAL